MKKIIYLAVSALLLTTIQTSAQVKFGVKTGLNVAKMVYDDDGDSDNDIIKSRLNYQLGITAEYAITEKIFLESGLFLNRKGFRVNEDGGRPANMNVSYLEIPIQLKYKTNVGKTKLFFHAGPYVGYALSARYTSKEKMFYRDGGLHKTFKLDIGNDKTDFIKHLDYGINIGAGVEMKKFTVGLQYSYGLANIISNTNDNAKVKNRVATLSVGYRLGK